DSRVRSHDHPAGRELVLAVVFFFKQKTAYEIGGSAHDREQSLRTMDQILLVAVGLLGAAVLIAIVGVGNTLTLSVLERSRESGMLRAMGMTASRCGRRSRFKASCRRARAAAVGGAAGTLTVG